MSWKIKTTDLTTYGVYVARSSGVLDKPAWQARNDGTDWTDEYGKEYWQDTTDLKKSDREIILNCWLAADSYSDFLAKLNNFKTLTEERDFTLTTPFGTIDHCYIPDGFTLVRETNYKMSRQVGVFTLRIIVAGDDQEDSISVYPPGGGTAKTTILTKNLKIYKRLCGDMYATCTTETATPLSISRGDFISIQLKGADADQYENFFLVIDPEVKKIGTNQYGYNLRWEYGTYGLQQTIFKSMVTGTPEESDFSIYANMEEIVDLILANSLYAGLITKGTVDTTERRNHQFSGESCFDVLRRICSEYELEWDFVSTSDIYHNCTWVLDVQSKIRRNWPYTLEYGKGEGLYEITRESVNKEELCTSLYAWGATKNLKSDYLYRRLKCPTMPLQSNVATYGVVEQTVFFEDIYPRFQGTVEGYLQYPSASGERATIGTDWEETDLEIYRIYDSGIGFDLNENEYLTGLPAKVLFTGTSTLAGMEFEIKRYDADSQHIYIKPFVDEYAGKYPNATRYPQVGDTYTFININQPDSYVTTAEAELLAAAQAWLTGDGTYDGHSVPATTYAVTVDPAFIRYIIGQGDPSLYQYAGFNVGDNIAIIDANLSISDLFRVSEIVKDCYTGRYELKLFRGNTLTNRQMLSIRLAAVERALQSTKADTVESQRGDQATTKDIETKILDPADGKIAADDVIRKESIDPGMMSFDAGTVQFMERGCVVDTNYLGVINDIYISSGEIDVLNWPDNTLSRWDIKKLRDGGSTYSPFRTWTVNSTVINLATDDGYYMFAKLPMATGDTTATIECDTAARLVKEDLPDYLYYTLGYINAPASKRQASMLWGNRKIYELPASGGTGQVLAKSSATDYDVDWVDPATGGVDTFLLLTDTPDSFTGQSGKIVSVASGETALEFVDPENDYVDSAEFAAASAGTPPTVDNTNNIVSLTLGRTGDLSDLVTYLGSMSAYKVWEGSQAEYDALGSWNDDTFYFVTE